MRKSIQNSITLLMAFVVLFSSTGYAKYIHICKITHKKEVSISRLESCCNKKASSNTHEFKKSACCSIEKSFNKISVEQESFKRFDFKFSYYQFHSLSTFQVTKIQIKKTLKAFELYPNPPPKPTLKRLSLLQLYII